MDLQEIYIGMNHWLRDLDFLDTERRFFRKIIKEYVSNSGLISLAIAEQFDQRLFQLEIDIHSLRDDIVSCKTRADMVIEKLVTGGSREIMEEYQKLGARYNELFSAFRKFKQELFDLTSRIIEEETMD